MENTDWLFRENPPLSRLGVATYHHKESTQANTNMGDYNSLWTTPYMHRYGEKRCTDLRKAPYGRWIHHRIHRPYLPMQQSRQQMGQTTKNTSIMGITQHSTTPDYFIHPPWNLHMAQREYAIYPSLIIQSCSQRLWKPKTYRMTPSTHGTKRRLLGWDSKQAHPIARSKNHRQKVDILPNQETMGHSLGFLDFLKPHPSCYPQTKENRDIIYDLWNSNSQYKQRNQRYPFTLALSVPHININHAHLPCIPMPLMNGIHLQCKTTPPPPHPKQTNKHDKVQDSLWNKSSVWID